MIRKEPRRREIQISSRPRWILIGIILLAPVVATVDIVSLSASARSATVAFGEHIAAGTWTGAPIRAQTTPAPEHADIDASRSLQWTFLRDVGAKAAALVHRQTAFSAPNVVGPSGAPRH